MIYKNKDIFIYIIKIYNLDYNNSGLTAIRLIIVNIENNNILRDHKVGIS